MNAPVVIWEPADLPAMVALAATFPSVDVAPALVVDIRSREVIA